MISSPVAAQGFLDDEVRKAATLAREGDIDTAVKQLIALAEDDNLGAQMMLAIFYNTDELGIQDYKKSLKWFGLLIKQETIPELSTEAQRETAVFYWKGNGVPQDFVMAHMWFNIAAANGDDVGKDMRDFMAEEMTSEDISKAQAMARKCMETNYKDCGY